MCVIEFVRVPSCRHMTGKMSVHLFGSESHSTGYRSAEEDGVSCSWRGKTSLARSPLSLSVALSLSPSVPLSQWLTSSVWVSH